MAITHWTLKMNTGIRNVASEYKSQSNSVLVRGFQWQKCQRLCGGNTDDQERPSQAEQF